MSKQKSSSKRSGQKVIRQSLLGKDLSNVLRESPFPLDPKAKLDQIIQDRAKVYGDVRISHRAIGYAFRAVLQNRWHYIEVPEIPPDLVAEMLAAFKLVRLARPTFHQDSADDLHNYVKFSEDMRRS